MGFFCFLNCCSAEQQEEGVVVKGVRKTTKELKETLKKYKLEDLRTELKALGIQVNEDQDKKTRKNDKKLKRELRKVLLRELKRVELQRQENKGEESEADEAPEVLQERQERVEPETEVGQEESDDRQQAADVESTGQQQDRDSTENGPMREKKRMEKVALVIKILDDITDMDEVNAILNEAVSILSEYKDIPQIHSNTYPSN